MDNYKGSQIGVIVECEEGYVSSSASYQTVEVFNPAGEQIEQFKGGGNHFQNFLDALASGRREDLNAEVLEGHLSSALCHMANVSHRTGREANGERHQDRGGRQSDVCRVGRPAARAPCRRTRSTSIRQP